MVYITNLIHAWLVFVAPLYFFKIKTNIKQQVIFTVAYASAVIFSRMMYQYITVPFGIHTILLVIINIFLLKLIVKELTWLKSIFIAILIFVIMAVNDVLIVIPIMKYFHLTISNIEKNPWIVLMLGGTIGNLGLIIMLLIRKFIQSHSRNSNF